MSKQQLYYSLRKDYPTFVYDSYSITEKSGEFKIQYKFIQSEKIIYYPEWTIPKSIIKNSNIEKNFLNELVFNLGMVELVSYWKAACSPVVKINAGGLDGWQKEWWKKLYFNGLSEFFYVNGITLDYDFMSILANKSETADFSHIDNKNSQQFSGNLIPIGGGKDSIVTLMLLQDFKDENHCFMLNGRQACIQSAQMAGYNDFIGIQRKIDPLLLENNKKGFLNGHTPFSAVLAFSSFLTAYLTNKKYIILSNESSANESNVIDTEINHQYSKSIEFENDFREYTSRYFIKSIEYFSLLRPLNEWRIVGEFVKHTQFYPIFKSCNVGSKTDSWCGSCPKCLYVYIMLSAFIFFDEVKNIFGVNMLSNVDLQPTLDGLVCESYDKPFECVGTRGEVNAALSKAVEKCIKEKITMPFLIEYYYKTYYEKRDWKEIENFYDSINNLPQKFLGVIKNVE